MIDESAIRSTFRDELLKVTGVDTSDINWENRSFTIPESADWIRERFIPASEAQESVGYTEQIGRVMYDVFTPENAGTKKIETLAKKIKEQFKPGTGLSPQIHITRSEITDGKNDGRGWYMVSVRITYRAYATV